MIGEAVRRCRCGAPAAARRGTRGPLPIWCSDRCRRAGEYYKRTQANKERRRRARRRMRCLQCGKRIDAQRSDKRWCGDVCRMRHLREFHEQTCDDKCGLRHVRMGRKACECGSAKDPGEEACEDCMRLDGKSMLEAQTIAAIRAMGGACTTSALEDALGKSRRQALRGLEALEAKGRIRRVMGGDGHQEETLVILRS